MRKNTFYFSHDANAQSDEKILCLIADYGFEGYGIYWLLIELMFETPATELKYELIRGLSHRYNIDISKLSNLIKSCVLIGLFESDKKTFWSNSLRSRKAIWAEKREKQSEGGKTAMSRRWGKVNKDKGLDKLLISSDNKVKESKVNKSKVKENITYPDWLPLDTFNDFKEKRKEIKKPLTGRAEELAIKALARLKESGNDPQAVLEQSIMGGWQGLFPVTKQKEEKYI